MPESSPLCMDLPEVEVLDQCLQIRSKMPRTSLPGDGAGLLPFPVDRSCRRFCSSVSSLEKMHKGDTAHCQQQMSYSLYDVQQVCENLPVLLQHIPSKVNVWEADWKAELCSRFASPGSVFPKGRGCNFRPLVNELQIFGETDKLLLIDCLVCLFPVLKVTLALKVRHEAELLVSGRRSDYATQLGKEQMENGQEEKENVTLVSIAPEKELTVSSHFVHVARHLNIVKRHWARTVPPPESTCYSEEDISVFQAISKELLDYLMNWLSRSYKNKI